MSAPTVAPQRARLRLRTPSGRVPWPRVLATGQPKRGKSMAIVEASRDPRIGATWILEYGAAENTGDQYGLVDGARYALIDHDGSYADVIGQLDAAREAAAEFLEREGRPVLLGFDSATGMRDVLSDWMDMLARRREARKLADKHQDTAPAWNPEREVTATGDLHSLVRKRWGQLYRIIHTWPGPVVVTAREDLVTPFENGQPKANAPKEWSIQGPKDLLSQMTGQVRYDWPNAPVIVSMRDPRLAERVMVGADDPETAPGLTVPALVFERLGCELGTVAPRYVEPNADAWAPGDLAAELTPAERAAAEQEQARVRRLHDAAAACLTAETFARLEEVTAKIGQSRTRDHVIPADALTVDDRDRLGIAHDAHLTPLQLARMVRDYLGRHGVGVRAEVGARVARTPHGHQRCQEWDDTANEQCGGFLDSTTGSWTCQHRADAAPAAPAVEEPAETPADERRVCGAPTRYGHPCVSFLHASGQCDEEHDHSDEEDDPRGVHGEPVD